MKRAFLISVICLIFVNLTQAQEQLPTEKKVTFGQNGKMYVNKDLGVYFWLSTSPEENAEKHRLMSDSSSRYSNPMYFDTEGYNTLRSPSAVDTSTKKTVFPTRDIIFEVYADGESPVSALNVSSKSTRFLKGKRYYSGEVKAALKAKDAVSGLEKTYYSIHKKAYAEYRNELEFNSDGEVSVKFYSTDKVGNRETAKEKVFTVDNTAPKTEYEIEGQINEKFVSPDAKIKLSANDNLVGVKTVYYQINGGAPKVYSYPVPVKWLGGSEGKITFWAVDHLNNKEEKKVIGGKDNADASSGNMFEFYVDKDAPVVNVEFEGQFSQGKYTYVSKETKLKVNADDDKSGVDQINYSINQKTIDQKYSDFIQFADDGVAYIRVNATDFVGNTSPTVVKTVYVDSKAPKTSAAVSTPKHRVKDTLFITQKTKINLSASDNASGVAKKFYTYNGKEETVYEGAFTLESEGQTTIKYRSVDNVGNKEETKTLEVFIDNNAPEIFHHYSSTAIGSKTVRDEEYTIYPSDVKLYVAATDKESGGEKITYKINNGPVKSLNPISGFNPGNYTVEITAYDILGNASKTEVKFAIEK